MTSAVTDNQLSSLVLSFTHASWKLTAKRDISCVKQPSSRGGVCVRVLYLRSYSARTVGD